MVDTKVYDRLDGITIQLSYSCSVVIYNDFPNRGHYVSTDELVNKYSTTGQT